MTRMSKTLYIGQLSRETGHSVHAIRWYEDQGLIPGVVRDGGGRRVYHKDHIEWLNFLHFLKKTGMSIKEMQSYTELAVKGWKSLSQRQKLLKAHKEKILADIEQMQLALTFIDKKVAYYEEWQTTRKRPQHSPTIESGKNKRIVD